MFVASHRVTEEKRSKEESTIEVRIVNSPLLNKPFRNINCVISSLNASCQPYIPFRQRTRALYMTKRSHLH